MCAKSRWWWQLHARALSCYPDGGAMWSAECEAVGGMFVVTPLLADTLHHGGAFEYLAGGEAPP